MSYFPVVFAEESAEHTAEVAAQATTTEATVEHAPASGGGIAEGAKALGLDGKLLIAQIINFIILLLVLRKFVYQPLMSLLEKRRTEIEKSAKQAEEIEKRYQEFQIEHAKRIEESKTESQAIIDKAKQAAEELRQETLKATQEENDKLIARTKAEIVREKETMFSELKQEIGTLVVDVVEKVVGKEVDEKSQKEMIATALKEVK